MTLTFSSKRSRQIKTRADLVTLISELTAEDSTQWENSDLGTFLGALGAWVEDCDGYYKNTGSECDPDTASWQVFADALQAARIYG